MMTLSFDFTRLQKRLIFILFILLLQKVKYFFYFRVTFISLNGCHIWEQLVVGHFFLFPNNIVMINRP